MIRLMLLFHALFNLSTIVNLLSVIFPIGHVHSVNAKTDDRHDDNDRQRIASAGILEWVQRDTEGNNCG